jgi:16S rRNA (cytosine967-C5)-methyltransferase
VRVEKPRQIAVRLLQQQAEGRERLESLLDQGLGSVELQPADRALVQELVYGVTRWQALLDWFIARKTQGRTQKQALQILLRLGLYQLFWLDRIPDHAAVHETVQLARHLGFGLQSGFINAVLRGCLRERPALEREWQRLKEQQPALGFSHPEWLCQRWAKRWDPKGLRALLEWNNTPAKVWARRNTLRADAEQLARMFEQQGVLFTPRQFPWTPADVVFELRAHPPLSTLPSFRQGLFYVQDPSTLLAVQSLDPQPGERVLDLCAAPGGKATYIAQLMGDRGTVVAEDASVDRLELLRQNCARLGMTCVVPTSRVSGAAAAAGPAGEFDRVLVDAPCSNTGVMRRRVELRWRIQPAELERLRRLQLGLLRQAASRLGAGGRLVYSTCSLEPEENQELIEAFCREAPTFRVKAQHELTPMQDEVDGAYVCVLERCASPEPKLGATNV